MEINAHFESLYSHDDELKNILARQEVVRKNAAKEFYISMGVVAAVFVALVVAAYFNDLVNKNTYYPILFGFCICCLIYGYLYKGVLKKVNAIYKKEVMPLMLNNLLSHYRKADTDQINYMPEYNVPINMFQSNPLFSDGNRISSEDLINGTIDKTRFAFYEAHYWEHTSNGKNSHVYDRFKGLAFMADFNKNFFSVTTISKGKPDGLSFFNAFNRLKKVTMEAGDFSKQFDVYSTNEQNARYIISTAFMERLMKLNEVTEKMRNDDISVIFRNSNMEIYIPSSKNRFEASVFSEMKADDVSNDFEALENLLSFIEVMNLNTRIWTKQ